MLLIIKGNSFKNFDITLDSTIKYTKFFKKIGH